MKEKSLIYVFDPMCSWCWGFSPVFEELIRRYYDWVTVRILFGGLRPGNTERFDEHKRAYILSHWHAVHERTGQTFNFNFQMDASFTYDTEPACRAGMVVRQISPHEEVPFLKAVQEAFYVHNENVTQEKILAHLAGVRGIDTGLFLEGFRDPAIRQTVWEQFEEARQLKVSGFPTLLGQDARGIITFTHGYQTIENLTPSIDRWLN